MAKAMEMNAQAKAADKLENLINVKDDEYKKRQIRKIISALANSNITKISQLRKIHSIYGDEAVAKLSEIRLIGTKTAEDILSRAIRYNYPKGCLPNMCMIDLPEWAMSEEANTISMNDLEEMCDESGKVDDEDLIGIFLNMIFDLFEDENIIPERINHNAWPDNTKDLLYTDYKIFVRKDFCSNIFVQKFKNIKTENNRNLTNKWFYVLQNCDAVHKNTRDGVTYCWGRKPRTFGEENRVNFIEIDIFEAESLINRKLNILNPNQLDNIINSISSKKEKEKKVSYSDLQRILVKENMNDKTTYYIVPLSCKPDIDGYTFNFKIIEIENILLS